jgi:aryl carrier-like protein
MSSSVTEVLKTIWEEVLEIEDITVEDDFFELGGDSLLGVTMISKARRAGVVFSFQDLQENPVLGNLGKVAIRPEQPRESLS